jgi:pseudomonalisin
LVIYSSSSAPLWQSNTSHVPSFSNSVLHSLSNGVLYPQQSLQTANRSRTLMMQRDGNMVLYSNGNPVWTPFTQGNPGAKAVMQSDGNFVIYNVQGRPLWWSGTGGNPGARIFLQDDSNLVIYSNGGVPLWQSYTLGR